MSDSSPARPTRSLPLAAVLLAAVLVVAPTLATPVSAQTDPTVSPPTVLSGDGRTATDGVRTLTVSQASDLTASGQTVQVSGRGYDVNKGVYVALCVIPPPNVLPTPCGGGVDTEGQAGASQWISSNPPSYGVGLARPYGPGGSFDVTFRVDPVISPMVDCRQVRCALLTRNDHSRSSDRSQDILVPVSFAAPAGPAPAPGAPAAPVGEAPAPTPVETTTTAPPSTTTTTTTPPAPDATVAADGRSVSDGTRTLRVERVEDLDPEGERVSVSGDGFDPARGVYVALCRIGGSEDPSAARDAGEAAAPAPCATGERRSAWLSSNPPDWGAELAEPFADGGRFEVQLELAAAIDAETDCSDPGVRCAVVVRADDTAAGDRSLDLVLPVAFGDGEHEEPAAERAEPVAGAPAASADDGSGPGTATWVLLAAFVAAIGAAAAGGLWWRTRREGGGRPGGAADGPAPDGAPVAPSALDQHGWTR